MFLGWKKQLDNLQDSIYKSIQNHKSKTEDDDTKHVATNKTKQADCRAQNKKPVRGFQQMYACSLENSEG